MRRSTRPGPRRDARAFLAGGGEMGELIREYDWSGSPLGPVGSWPNSLEAAVAIMLRSRYPMFVWWGEELIHLYNDAYIPVLGERHPAALGRGAAEVWSDVWPVVGPQADAVLHEGRATWNEELLLVMERNRRLEETYFTFSYSPILDDGGEVGGLFCALTEETARVLSRRRLRTLRALAAKVSRASTVERACAMAAATLAENPYDLPFVLLYVTERDGRAARLVGVTSLDRRGPAVPELIELGGRDAPWLLDSVAETGKGLLLEELPADFFRRPCGPWPEPPQRAIVLPMARTGRDEIAGFVVVGLSPRLPFTEEYRAFLDLVAGHIAAAIGHARASEEERGRAKALADLDRAKTAFLANVSHELRTPLTLMLGPVEEVLSKPEDDVQPSNRELLGLVHRHGLRLLELVHTLLDFSRLEAGSMKPSYRRTDIATLTGDLASMFRTPIEKADLRFVVACSPIEQAVYLDRDLWEKILLNLLSNAFQFTFEGEIEVRLRETDGAVELSVRDTGVGIPSSELGRVFDRFHRVEGSRRRSRGGSGIGLTLVRELAELHGGSAVVESVEGAGTTVTVTIPTGRAHLPPESVLEGGDAPSTVGASPLTRVYLEDAWRQLPDDEGEPEAAADVDVDGTARTRAAAHGGASRPCVLVVEDDRDVRQYVRRLLSARFDVETAANGKVALEALRRRRPELVLTDARMPELDGFGLLAEIRADPELCEIPVVMLSARAGEEAIIESIEAGVDDYLTKPFSARELLARVSSHVRMAALRREMNEARRASEERLRVALAAGNFGDWQLDLETMELTASARCKQSFGRAPDEAFTYELFLASIHPDDRDRAREALECSIAERRDYEAEFRCAWPDGSIHWISARARVVAGRDGRAEKVIGLTLDVTERKQAEDALRRSEARKTAMFETALDCIVTVDHEGRIVEFNPAAERTFGYSRKEALGQDLAQLVVPPALRARQRRAFRRTVATGRGPFLDRRIETSAVRSDGTEFPVEWAVTRLPGDGPPLFTAFLRDITQRKRAEQRLTAQYAVSRVLAESTTLAEATAGMLAALCEHLSWDIGALWLSDPQEQVLRCAGFHHRAGVEAPRFEAACREQVFGRGRGMVGRVWARGKALSVPDFGAERDFSRSRIAVAEGLRGAIGLPIVLRDQVIGVVELLSREVRREDEEVLELLTAIGSQIGQFVERTRAEEAKRESEERFERFTQQLPGLAWIKDLQGRYVFANEAALQVFRKRHSELYGLTDGEIFPEEFARQFRDNDVRALASESGYQTVEIFRQGDGALHSSIVSKFPISGADGRVAWIGGIAIDVTEQRRAEEALRASEARFRSMANTMPVVVWTADPTGTITFHNQRWFDYTGLTTGESARGWEQVLHPDDRERRREAWSRALRDGTEYEIEVRYRGRDGQYRWFLTRATPIRGEHGEIVEWYGSTTDIHDRKQAEEDLRAADRRKDEFLATLAHELRNPLAPLRTGLETLELAGPDTTAAERARTMMERQLLQLIRLVDDLLDVSRISRGKVTLRKERVDIAAVVEQALETSRPVIEHGRHQLELALPAEPAVVDADPTRLAQVFSNLLHNAAKFTEPGGHIQLIAERVDDELLVTVRDDGIGISTELLPKVFDLFTQFDHSPAHAERGLGIGLSLVKALVELHRGSIEARSEGEGLGSEFVIRLPVAHTQAQTGPTGELDRLRASGPRRILVVDDNLDAANSLAALLAMMGHETETAHDGEQAIQVASSFRPDVMLLDIGMPKLSGYQVAESVRQQPWGRSIVLVAVTGWGQEEDRRRSRAAGFDFHLVKPVALGALEQLLAGLETATV